MFNLYLHSNSAAEHKGTFECSFDNISVERFQRAADYLKREPGAVGVWGKHGNMEWYVERA